MKYNIHPSWQPFFETETRKPYFQQIEQHLENEKFAGETLYPKESEWFAAMQQTPLSNVKVVILGQDPYHGPGQAHGLAFSVPEGISTPPSLRNIFKEIQADVYPKSTYKPRTDLTRWAHQGVLLLNTSLTVRAGEANSHRKIGWQTFTDGITQHVSATQPHVVFMLWGNFARAKKELVNIEKHTVLEAPHPSPLSAYRGFFGCKYFSKANEALVKNNQAPIDW